LTHIQLNETIRKKDKTEQKVVLQAAVLAIEAQ
jgi:hypothetical protein